MTPSAARIFGKSMYMVASGWLVSVSWLWVAGVRQYLRRQGDFPPEYAVSILIGGALVGLGIWLTGRWLTRATGPAPDRRLERREWHHAFWWALFPNLMLLGTVWLMIAAAV